MGKEIVASTSQEMLTHSQHMLVFFIFYFLFFVFGLLQLEFSIVMYFLSEIKFNELQMHRHGNYGMKEKDWNLYTLR